LAPKDLDSLEQLFRLHYNELRQFAYRYVKSEAQAEEIVQDVFLTVWTRRKEISAVASMRAYLFAAVRNKALHHTRHAAVELRFAQSERQETSEAALDATDERVEDLDAAIAALPERTRTAIELRWLRQMSHAEVAAAMNISVKGVEKLLARGMSLLRGRMTP
jgi:RNA polymerase sigma-70 factor (ECF subfamily)